MGYCCFCIPLTPYGILFALIEIIVSGYLFIELCLYSVPEASPLSVTLEVFVELFYILAALGLLAGIVQRSYRLMYPFLVLIAVSIIILLGAALIFFLVSPILFSYFLGHMALTALLSIPVFVLYVEIRDEAHHRCAEFNR